MPDWRICAPVNYTIMGSDSGLSLGRRQAIILGDTGILIIEPLEQISVKT